MTAVLNVLGTNVAVLDTTNPYQALTQGEGARGTLKVVEDVVALTTAFVGATGNYARFCRFPANAKVKSLEVQTDAPLDSNSTQTLALNFGVSFSDSTIDETPSYYQGQIPTTTGIGGGTTTAGTVTSFSAYSSPNDIFGTITLSGNNLAIPKTDITFKSVPGVVSYLGLTQVPLISLFNFWDGRSQAQQNLGWLDVYVYVKTTAATAHAANLYAKLAYVD